MATSKLETPALTKLLLGMAYAYGRYSPVFKGKGRLCRAFAPLLDRVGSLQTKSIYGTRFDLRFPDDRGYECIHILGTYEAGTSKLVRRVLKSGDIALDVGANIGWYTTLFAKCVAPDGIVHAFEPVPFLFEKLQRNCTLSNCESIVRLNKLALGRTNGTIRLFAPKDGPHLEISIFPECETANPPLEVPCVTLDDYCAQHINKKTATLIKLDVEGAEPDVIDGAQSLLNSPHPPMWLCEFNRETARRGGFSPYAALERLAERGYRFIRVKLGWRGIAPVRNLEECQHGDNVLCYIPNVHRDRLRGIVREE